MGWNKAIWAGVFSVAAMMGAVASPTCTTTTDLGSSGVVLKADVTAGACFKVDNVVYGNINISGLPSKTVLLFNTNIVNGIDHIQLTFGSTWQTGHTYSWSYELAIATGAPAGTVFTALDSDFDQTAGGKSILDKITDPTGDAVIHMVKIGANLQAGSVTSENFGPDLTSLKIMETLKDRGTIASVTNTVSVYTPPQNPPVPEPATLLIVGAGLLGLGRMKRKRE